MNTYGLPMNFKEVNGRKLQSTGMTDAAGNEVFFGDIVTIDDDFRVAHFEVVMRKGEVTLNEIQDRGEPLWIDAYSGLQHGDVKGNVFTNRDVFTSGNVSTSK